MKKYLFLLCMFFLSGCLLTHKEIKEEKNRADQEENWLDEDTAVSQEAGVKRVKNKGVVNTPSVIERVSQIETSLRELRGQIDNVSKQQEDRLVELEQGLLSLIQSLDLRVAALTEEVKAKKQSVAAKPEKKKEQNSEEFFNKAEELFKDNKWKEAIIHYEKYREKNKNNKKKFYIKSTLQIGLCFQKLEMHKEAKVFFREVVESFPKSAEAKEAKKLLSKKAK